MKIYIYSTLSADMNYTNHAAGGADMPIELPPVFIKGGAGVVNDRLVTPRGVVTEITEEQLQYLRENPVFQMHEKNGFIQVSEADINPDKAAADMTGRDASAPIVPQDELAGDAETVVGGDSIEEAPKKRGKK